ncbi:MAG: transporter substrate-binding domain-containing protein [Thermotogaceae bacterium]|nr:transporter substrate-binding domain-containing protein [Thermotogaceae bacterium]
MRRFMVFVMVLVISFFAFADLLDEIRARGVLRIGQDAGYMPLYGTDEKGNRVGFEVDLAKKMAEILGVKLEFVVVNWDGIIPALISGKFDIISSGMTITPERALKVDFTDPYLTVGQTVLYSTKKYSSAPRYSDLKNIEGLRVAVQLGTTGDEAARRLFPNANILAFDTMDEAAYQVASGRADIMVVDSIFAQFMAKKYSVLEVSGELLTKENLGIAVRRGNLEFLHWLNTFIRWARTSGLIDQLKARWGISAE